uniref:Uncharacterized protein n=1 Tax=Sphaerodactylus townsendi TaxID=933632 RepID=A0ACB8FK40_9SAUR
MEKGGYRQIVQGDAEKLWGSCRSSTKELLAPESLHWRKKLKGCQAEQPKPSEMRGDDWGWKRHRWTSLDGAACEFPGELATCRGRESLKGILTRDPC